MIRFTGKDYSFLVPTIGLYSDNTPFIKVGEEAYEQIKSCADTVVIKATGVSDLFAGLAMVAGVNRNGGHVSNLVLPYLPGARQDRVNPTGDVMATASVVAHFINVFGFSCVLVADPHSKASIAEINNVVEFPMAQTYEQLWKGYSGVIAPDKGAADRAALAGRVLNKKVITASKERDVSTGRLSGFDVTVVPGEHYIVIDDICDGGGTFLGLGEKIREQGAYADLFVTHGIFKAGTRELKQIYKNIYTTDTRQFNDRNEVYIVNIVERMIAYV